jgi:hypothetical protein
MEAGMKVHINETNAGDFQTTFSHPGTNPTKTPKEGVHYRFADYSSDSKAIATRLPICDLQVGIKGQHRTSDQTADDSVVHQSDHNDPVDGN